jgi:ketosteroid isomerase-like protein
MDLVTDLDPETEALAVRMFAAVAAGDKDELLRTHAADCVVWHSFDEREVDLDTVFKILGALADNLKDVRFENQRRQALPDGFLQQHVITGTLSNGDALRMPSCMIIRVSDGQVTRVEEYIDGPAIRSLASHGS